MRGLFAFYWGVEMDYMTITEASKKWKISNRRIQTLCAQGRIPGAERLGYCWLLPKEAVKPTDGRIKSGKYIKNDKTTKPTIGVTGDNRNDKTSKV